MFRVVSTSALLAMSLAVATPAFAQAPTEAQREAIKSDCRSDYIAHCSSVPPGGAASLQCLQKNMASLSGACAAAVKAVEAPASATAAPESAPAAKQDTKTEPAPAAEPAKPAAAAPAAAATAKTASAPGGKPSSAQIAAIKSSCRSDYPKVCASVPPGGAAALECLEKNKAKLSAACGKAVAAAGMGGAAPSAAAAAVPATASASPAAVPPPPPRLVLRPLLPREELFVLRSACAVDVRSLCGGVAPGGGRIIQCLAVRSASLSPDCMSVLGRFATQ
jgi:hypothetical protein